MRKLLMTVSVLLGLALPSLAEDKGDWKTAVAALKKRGAEFVQESPDKPPTALDLVRVRDLNDDDLARLKDLPTLQKVVFYHQDAVTEKGLENLKGLTGLKDLSLCGIEVTGKSMKVLEGLTDLEKLHLGNTPVTDDDLASLKGLKKLKSLQLYNTKITGPGLKHLAELSKLEFLTLNQNKLSDDCVGDLKKLTGLKELYVGGLTMQGEAELKKALPDTKIKR